MSEVLDQKKTEVRSQLDAWLALQLAELTAMEDGLDLALEQVQDVRLGWLEGDLAEFQREEPLDLETLVLDVLLAVAIAVFAEAVLAGFVAAALTVTLARLLRSRRLIFVSKTTSRTVERVALSHGSIHAAGRITEETVVSVFTKPSLQEEYSLLFAGAQGAVEALGTGLADQLTATDGGQTEAPREPLVGDSVGVALSRAYKKEFRRQRLMSRATHASLLREIESWTDEDALPTLEALGRLISRDLGSRGVGYLDAAMDRTSLLFEALIWLGLEDGSASIAAPMEQSSRPDPASIPASTEPSSMTDGATGAPALNEPSSKPDISAFEEDAVGFFYGLPTKSFGAPYAVAADATGVAGASGMPYGGDPSAGYPFLRVNRPRLWAYLRRRLRPVYLEKTWREPQENLDDPSSPAGSRFYNQLHGGGSSGTFLGEPADVALLVFLYKLDAVHQDVLKERR